MTTLFSKSSVSATFFGDRTGQTTDTGTDRLSSENIILDVMDHWCWYYFGMCVEKVFLNWYGVQPEVPKENLF